MAQHIYDQMTPAQRYDLLMNANAEAYVDDRYRVSVPPVGQVINLSYNDLPYPYRCAVAYAVEH